MNNVPAIESEIAATTETELSGTVAAIYYAKPSFSAGRIRAKGRGEVPFSVKGFVKINEPVTLRGKWGMWQGRKQFEATEVVYTMPADPDGLAKWLEWNVPGVGAVKGRKLIDEFGIDLPTIAASDPQQVAIFAGMTIEAVHKIAEEWASFSAKISASSELASFGLTQLQVEILWAKYKGSAVTILREDPYLLLRQGEGFGFKTVDDIARKLGVPADHPGRKRAAYIQAIADAEDKNGSTAVRESHAVEDACGMLEMPVEMAGADVLERAAEAAAIDQVRRMQAGAEWFAGLPASHAHEKTLWQALQTARDANPYFKACGPSEFVRENYGRVGEKHLDADQLGAVVTAVKNRVSFITGGAGSGKTLVARAIAKVFSDANIPIYLCAPTGKAARRLTDVIGREASTIHRLLGYQGHGFLHNNHNPLPDGVVICDEFSMVDSSLAYSLFRSISPRSAIVCIGDPNQLPPVQPGAMLRDVLAHDLAPVARLSHCHRQAGPLKANCSAILAGRVEPSVMEFSPAPWMVYEAMNEPSQVVRGIASLFDKYLAEWGYDPVKDVQFLTAMHKGELGTKYLNRVCQRIHQKKYRGVELEKPDVTDESRPALYPGDKVIHIKNNYKLGVMNGTQGTVESVGKYLVVGYDDKEVSYDAGTKSEVELAYVLTPHKAQGSEWPCAVVVCHKKHSFMQTRAWLYTAATRAQRTAVIIGDEASIRRAAQNDKRVMRGTWLEAWAENEGSRPS